MHCIETLYGAQTSLSEHQSCTTHKYLQLSPRPKLLPYVLSEGLKRANDSVEEIELGIEHAMLDAIPKVNSVVSFLATKI